MPPTTKGFDPPPPAGPLDASGATEIILYNGVVLAPAGAIPTPSGTVTGPDAFGGAAHVGASAAYSRGDHDHGLPAAPAVPAASGTVTGPPAYGAAPVVGVAATYSKGDHIHGLPAAGGGLAQSYIGRNVAGATPTAFATAGATGYAKQVVLAGAVTLLSIGAYLDMHAAAGLGLAVGVYADAAGSPGALIAFGSFGSGAVGIPVLVTDTPQWVDAPVAVHLAAGTYWLVVQAIFQGGQWRIYSDAGGGDGIITSNDGGFIEPVAAGKGTFVAGVINYSIRASVLS